MRLISCNVITDRENTDNDAAMGKFQELDSRYLDKRSELSKQTEVSDLFEIADHFGLFSGVQTIGRSLAIYEAFK